MKSDSIISIKDLSFCYKNRSKTESEYWKEIFSEVTFDINRNQVVGLVGKSGCGKTTLGKLVVGYFNINKTPTKVEGDVLYTDTNGQQIDIKDKAYKRFRIPPIQMVFQDPRTSLNMKMNIYDQLYETFKLRFGSLSHDEIDSKIDRLMKELKIDTLKSKNPSNISGGQRRRFGLAKILAIEPDVIIADEPVASLDVSIKQDVMDLLFEIRDRGITIMIISHDIALLKKNADMIHVMDRGKLVESWDPKKEPQHPATIELVDDSDYVNKFINKITNDG